MILKIILFVLLIGIPAFFTIRGVRRGFLKTLLTALALIVSLVLVSFLSGTFTKLIDEHTSLRSSVQEKIYEKLEEKVTEKHAETEEQQKEAVSGTFIPQVLLDVFENKENPFGSPQDSYITRVSSNMADVVLDICGIFIALVISWVIMGVLLKLSGLVAKMPLLGGMNALLGGILGIIYGIIIVFFICLFITLISGTEFGQKIMEAITSSDILSFVYGGALKLEAFILSL